MEGDKLYRIIYRRKKCLISIFGLVLVLVLLGECSVIYAAVTVEDSTLGFTLSLPEGFQKYPELVNEEPNIVQAYVIYEDQKNLQPQTILIVEKLGGKIGRERLDLSMMPPDFNGSLLTMKWHQLELYAFEIPEEIEGRKFVTYGVLIPLKQEAIRLKMFGPMERKSDLLSLLHQTLDGLKGETNWQQSIVENSISSSKHYGTVLLVIAVIAIIGGLVALSYISKHSSKGVVLVLSIPIFAAESALDASNVREVVLLCGILKILGFAALGGGILDIFRKGRSKEKDDPESSLSDTVDSANE